MIGILTSGVALGVHVPGLLLAQRLREDGVETTVEVLERLLPDRKRETTASMKSAFHRDFRLARAARGVASDPSELLDETAVRLVAHRWKDKNVRRLVVFSGFWLPIIERHAVVSERHLDTDVCHVDSVPSPSFLRRNGAVPWARHIRLVDAAAGSVPRTIPVSRRPPIDWAARHNRLLVHGGGWGMGTYRQRADDLRRQGFQLDVIAYEATDVNPADPGTRYYMIDPAWHPWIDDGFPPFGPAVGDATPAYIRGTEHHGSFDLARSAMAMVSKPGGGTLLDSLWSATPLVLLEPFGPHEQHNSELWEKMGFGISFSRWQASGFDTDRLEQMHVALLQAAPRAPDYSRQLAREVSQ